MRSRNGLGAKTIEYYVARPGPIDKGDRAICYATGDCNSACRDRRACWNARNVDHDRNNLAHRGWIWCIACDRSGGRYGYILHGHSDGFKITQESIRDTYSDRVGVWSLSGGRSPGKYACGRVDAGAAWVAA